MDFETRADIKKWLNGQSLSLKWDQEELRRIAIVFAARAALRSVPFLANAKVPDTNFEGMASQVVLPVFWTLSTTLVAGNHLENNSVLKLAKSATMIASQSLSTVDDKATAYTLNAVHAAAGAASNIAYIVHAAGAVFATANAARSSTNVGASIWSALNADKRFVEALNKTISPALALTEAPLWEGGISGMPMVLKSNWSNLYQKLTDANQDWNVWTDWYISIINGNKLDKVHLEIAKNCFLIEAHKKGSGFANAELKRIEKKYNTFVYGNGNLSYGVKYEEKDSYLSISGAGETDDIVALENPHVRNIFNIVKRKANELYEISQGRCTDLNWEFLEESIARFQNNIQVELPDLSENILFIFHETLELAGFLQESKQLSRNPSGNKSSLPPDIDRGLQNLINTLAPWIRQFPSAREQDRELGELLGRPELYAPSYSFILQAGQNSLITKNDQQLLLSLIEALNQSGFIANKRSVLGQGSAYNLIVKAVALPMTFMLGATSSAVGNQSIIARKATNTILAAESAIIEIIRDAPDDIRLSVKELIEAFKHIPENDLKPLPSPKGISKNGEESSLQQDTSKPFQ